MAAFNQIGSARARAKLAVAKAKGVSVQFSHRGAAAVSLYVNVKGQKTLKQREAGIGIEAELRVLVLEIPVQDNFAVSGNDVEPITPHDQITYLSRKYFVMEPIDKDDAGYVYTVSLAERKRLGSGV